MWLPHIFRGGAVKFFLDFSWKMCFINLTFQKNVLRSRFTPQSILLLKTTLWGMYVFLNYHKNKKQITKSRGQVWSRLPEKKTWFFKKWTSFEILNQNWSFFTISSHGCQTSTILKYIISEQVCMRKIKENLFLQENRDFLCKIESL